MPDTPPHGNPEPGPTTAAASATGLAPHVAASIATLFSIVGGIVFLVLETKDKFVRFWAIQAVFLGGILLIVSAGVWIVEFIFRLIPWIGRVLNLVVDLGQLAFNLVWLAVYVICLVKAFSRQEWEIPWLGPIARRQLARTDSPVSPPGV